MRIFIKNLIPFIAAFCLVFCAQAQTEKTEKAGKMVIVKVKVEENETSTTDEEETVEIRIVGDEHAKNSTTELNEEIEIEMTVENGVKHILIKRTDAAGQTHELEWEGTGDPPAFIQQYLQQPPSGGTTEIEKEVYIIVTDGDETALPEGEEVEIEIEIEEATEEIIDDNSVYQQLQNTPLPESLRQYELDEAAPLVQEIEFYPVPTSDLLEVRFRAQATATSVRIVDSKGKAVYTEELTGFDGNYQQEIDLSGNPPGVYFLQIVQGKQQHVEKIMLQ